MPRLDIADLKANYGAAPVLDGISLSIGSGEVLGLIGPSGSGKSTILRLLVGLLRPTFGSVSIDGVPVNYINAKVLRQVRDRFAIVFQQYNLFQNMSVLDNVTIAPIKIKKASARRSRRGSTATARKSRAER